MNFPLKRIASAFALAIAFLLPSHSSAAIGEKTLGFSGGYASYNGGGYADLYFQYSLAPHIRIAPELGYIFRNENKSGFECSVDMQFPFRLARGFNAYPLAGVTLNNWSYKHGGHVTRGGFDFGGGFDIRMTSELKLTLQAKYSLMNDTSGCFIGMGIGYNF